ncbi:MAG: hypothetical protein V9E87_05790 [Gemmatimonadales bacterium]
MANNLPGRIDRATFDRVLQRAAELQAASHDIGEGLTEEEVVALGNEVGIAPAGAQAGPARGADAHRPDGAEGRDRRMGRAG